MKCTPPRLFLFFDVAFAISAACGAYPLRFDHKSVRFYTTRISRWPCLGFTAVSLIQLVFSLVRNIQLGQSMVTKEEIYMFNVTYLIVLGHVIPLICTLLIILQPDDFVLVLNRVVGYALDVKRRYVSERKDFCEFMLRVKNLIIFSSIWEHPSNY